MSAIASPPLIVITGATDGIGRETALELARRGALVLIHGRNPARLKETWSKLRGLGASGPAPVPHPDPIQADLGSFEQVRGIVRELERRGLTPDVLLNNAGIYQNQFARSTDGFELTFAVNHLAPFLLTHELLASPAGARLSRIVNVSSVAHSRGRIQLDDLDFSRRGFDPYGTYAASKLANVLFTVELARRLTGRTPHPTANALHPGVVSTKLLTDGFGMRGSDSLAEGAATSVRLSWDEDVALVSGGYFVRGRPASRHPQAEDEEFTRAFYDRSLELTAATGLPPRPGR